MRDTSDSVSDSASEISKHFLSQKRAKDDNAEAAEKLLLVLQGAVTGASALFISTDRSHVVMTYPQANIDLFRTLHDNSVLAFDFLVDITAVDYLDSTLVNDIPGGHQERFEVVYHLLSLKFGHRIRVKVPVSEERAVVQSVTAIWPGANFMEREVWDMYGVKFEGHPDLRRILMYDEFKGHPLRKDYPVQLKQPRVTLRAPEVQNTARQMIRPDLVSITKRK